jgi:uroporphyrinogen decarboxylase
MHLITPPLAEPSLEGFSFPDLDDLYTAEWESEALQAIQKYDGYFTTAGFGFGIFERTWVTRGFNEALMDAVGDPDFYDELSEAIAVHQLEIIDRLLELPVDGIFFSDDWGYQQGVLLGPDRWRRFMKPRLARMYERVHDAGRYTLSHCCGSVADIMPDIIEIGLDVLESVQPEAAGMNPYELKREYGDQIAFWGGLGSQSTVPFGTPEEIKGEVARLCGEMGRGGGYILTTAKALQPETPTENAAAVVEAFIAQDGRSVTA